MKARDLSDVYDIFDPQEPLSGDKLREYYVERASPVKSLANIFSSEKPLKYLFVGSRGNGKSTELNRLSEFVSDTLFVVSFSVKDKLNLFDVDYADILLVIATEIYESVSDKLSKQLRDYLDAWSEKIVERVKEKQSGLEFGAGFWAIVNLAGKVKTQATTREVTREVMKPRLSDFIDAINRIIADAERELGKKILVIIDDLDKINLEKGEELFYKHGAELTQPVCKIIYTIPQPLLFSNKIRQIVLRYFDGRVELPNVRVKKRNGEVDHSGYKVMKEVALRRMEEDLITEEAMNEAIKSSGGILTEFIRIIRDAANIAHMEDRSGIEEGDVERVVTDIRNDYIRILNRNDIKILKEVARTKEKTDEDRFHDLLFSLAILEYANDEVWYDIHPATKGIIERVEAGEG
ncbi:MAG: hypothetical protein ACXQTW_05865 [Candidatus Methanospirareceae archaeon]